MIYLVFDHPHFQLYHFIILHIVKDSGFLKFLLSPFGASSSLTLASVYSVLVCVPYISYTVGIRNRK